MSAPASPMARTMRRALAARPGPVAAGACALIERRPATPVATRAPLPTREWLVRVAFSLLAVMVVLATVLTALSLLDGAEAAGLLLPVVALAAIVVGFYLGAEAAGGGGR